MKLSFYKGSIHFYLPGIIAFCILAGLALLSCGQNPIFYHISIEPPPKDPRIAGTPANIVVVKDAVYSGSINGKKIHRNDNSGWSEISQPGGSVIELASDGDYLYALTYSGDPLTSTTIKKYDSVSETWTDSFSYPGYSIQTIYGIKNNLFAGAQLNANRQEYAILYLDTVASNLIAIKTETGLLTGAAEKKGIGIFIATNKNGIFKFNETLKTLEDEPVTGTEGVVFTGIIETGGSLVAVSSNPNGKDGVYISYNGESFSSTYTSLKFTGAICVWEQFAPTASIGPNVSISPAAVTIQRGNSYSFDAVVNGLGLTEQDLTWSISEASGITTIIDTNGLLTLDPDEVPGTEILVKAVSVVNPNLIGTSLVTVADEDELDGVVTVTASGNPVAGEILTANTDEVGEGTETLYYQWERSGVTIEGATEDSYTLVDLDLGEDIRVTVSCEEKEGSVSSTAVTVILDPDLEWKPALLLFGIQGQNTSTSHGYREMVLDKNSGRPLVISLKMPGSEAPTTVTEQAKYNASIAKYPVRSILQMPKEMVSSPLSELDLPIFASTVLKGLWSCRNGEWNAED